MSSSSKIDPLSAILLTLGIRAKQRTVLEAGGSWALAFPLLYRLKFVGVVRGHCWLMTQDEAPRLLHAGDLALIGRCAYRIASDPAAPPMDGLPFYTDAGDRVQLGGDDTLLMGGGVEFTSGTADFLLELLPSCLVVERDSEMADVVATILDLLDREARVPKPGAEAVNLRLAELLVIEAIRFALTRHETRQTGWLGALVHPKLGRALQKFHADVARPWTVQTMAEEAGMSRAAFSAAFTRMIGKSPNAYVRGWRMTLARARLRSGISVFDTALEVGYQSSSAFGFAYRATFGVAPGSEKRAFEAPDE